MTEVQHVTEVAKGISDYGMMAVSAAFFLLLSAAMMIALFKWFKSMINRLLEQQECLNHIADREATVNKIRKSLQVIHDDRKSRFDPFIYHGKPLSEYCNENWVEDVVSVVESEIYNEDGENNARAYTNVKLAYDNIKTDFYQRLNS